MKPPSTELVWTADALSALQTGGTSRRSFLKGSGALIVGFSALGMSAALAPEARAAQGINGAGSDDLDAWIAIRDDGGVTAYTGKCELGHGLYTAQTQLIAEELGVSFDRVTLIQCDTALTPDQGTTSGAQSHPANFNHANLALAAATAREALLVRASTAMDVPVDQLIVDDGTVRVESDPDRQVGYAELLGGRSFSITLDPGAERKPSSSWTILGQPIPRVEIPEIMTGDFEYVHNVRVDGMLHGRVVRPPVVGATLIAVDETSVQDMPGVVSVVVRNNFIGVVAEKAWQAVQAAERLEVNWSTPPGPLPQHEGFHDWLRVQTPTRDTLLVDSQDVDRNLDAADQRIEASYHYPYQMHASIGSACAVADVGGDSALVWSATQAVHPLKSTVAMVLDMDPENVRVIFRMGAGCYGVNGADTVSYDAALMSQAVGRPVRVQLSRKDEMAWENYGNAFAIDQRAGLNADGDIVTWDHESWSPNLGSRPRANRPGNVVTGFLAGFEPAPFADRSPAPAPTNFNNGSNGAPSYVTGEVGGNAGGTGSVASQRVLTRTVPSPFFTGPLRSPARLQNTFAHESFIDEIATSVQADPVEYRLRHLRDPRLIAVVRAAAQRANWDTRPSPRSDNSRTGRATGRGISCVFYEGDNGYCSIVAEVEVDQGTGAVEVRKLTIANDCGPISNPDGLRNQLEGGALHGVSRTLLEEVTWDDEKITSIDWQTYRPLYVGAQIPEIETVLINQSAGEAMGAGETAVTVVAGAIANAVFDATGVRIRQIPFTRERVLGELRRRG
jgi:nicotinate dehydrogenase subunit B